ncbi:helix-turn-helix domain-containing protein [Pueribacillus sp. YX66]|uniref:helix-turn-helix domain-containing protein n=1 Tax=Pueribacillus sp. YX66 TaxID=3229242 RepID=UPI00358D3CCB
MSNELGTFLEAIRTEKKLSLREAASLTGLGHSYIRDLELGINRKTGKKVVPSINSLRKIASAYNLDIYDLLNKAGLIDIDEIKEKKEDTLLHDLPKKIPVFESISSFDSNDVVDYVYFPFKKSPQPDFAITMKGDSMSGSSIDDDDIVFFRKYHHPEYNGQIVAVRLINENTGTIRRITWTSQFPSYTLICDNKNYRTINVPFNEVEIYGVYCGHFKPEKS